MLTSLLIYRFVLANALGVALSLALAWSGYIVPVFETDQSRVTFAIAGLFLIGWVWTLKEAIFVSRSLDRSKTDGYRPASVADAEKAMLKIEWLESIPEWLVGLGLLGTVIGFSVALSGIDQNSLMQATGAQNAVAALMSGMRVALNTTLLGAALAIWHQVNLRMLKTAMGCYWIDRVRSGAGKIAAGGQD